MRRRKSPARPRIRRELIEQGKLLYAELACAGCHDLTGEKTKPAGPDLTYEGSKPVHDLDFGEAKVKRTLPDFLYTKLKSPKALSSSFRLHLGEDAAAALWKNLQPAALFSQSASLPEGSDRRSARLDSGPGPRAGGAGPRPEAARGFRPATGGLAGAGVERGRRAEPAENARLPAG